MFWLNDLVILVTESVPTNSKLKYVIVFAQGQEKMLEDIDIFRMGFWQESKLFDEFLI